MCRISSGGGSQKFKPLKARVTAMYCTPKQTRSTLLEKRRASSRSMSLGAECVATREDNSKAMIGKRLIDFIEIAENERC